jgi:DNA primase
MKGYDFKESLKFLSDYAGTKQTIPAVNQEVKDEADKLNSTDKQSFPLKSKEKTIDDLIDFDLSGEILADDEPEKQPGTESELPDVGQAEIASSYRPRNDELISNEKRPDVVQSGIASSSTSPQHHKLDAMVLDRRNDELIGNGEGKLLAEVIKHYQKNLNKEALNYLDKRGLNNPEIINRFKIGYCNNSLLSKLSEAQKETLKDLGILKANSKTNEYFEAFNDCLTIPILDENDNPVSIYGRSIKDDSNYPHLYLSGKHKGVFNAKASKVYAEIILTESIIDALSLIKMGFQNVQACYGVNGFTDEHLEKLKEDNVRLVTIAFDNDDPGEKAADKLKDNLLKEGFAVKIISPINQKDWNQALTQLDGKGSAGESLSKDEIDLMISNAELFKHISTPLNVQDKNFIYRRENKLDVFTLGDITYKLGGAKETFVNNLKVSITAERGDEFFPDTLDLCNHRSRMGYCNNLAERFAIEPKRIENDLLTILRFLQDQMNKRFALEEGGEAELTDEEAKLGLSFLRSPDMFVQIINDIADLGYVGDDLNKKLLYLTATSRVLDDPINVLIISQSSAGKSYLVDTVARMLPESEVVNFNTVSKQGLQYMRDKMMHKFMPMGEDENDPTIDHQLREIMSSHRLTRYVAQKNEKTGEIITEKVEIKAYVATVLTTTNNKVHPENANRYFITTADETAEQTNRIYQAQKDKFSEEKEIIRQQRIPVILSKHRSAQRLLKKLKVIFPEKMREALKFPDRIMRLRRDHQRFINLIATVCFLRQYQKQTQNNGHFDYILCDAYDYEVAYEIVINGLLQSTINELPQQAVSLYDNIRKYVRDTADIERLKPADVSFTQRQIREFTGLNQMYVKRYIRALLDYEYLKVKGGNARGSKGSYSLTADEELADVDLSIIPTPKQMKKVMGEGLTNN